MQTFTITTSRPNRLHDDLLAAAAIPADVRAALRVESGGSACTVYAPDGADPAPIRAVLAAHDPAVPGIAEAAETERGAATGDLRAQYAAASARLDAIVAAGSSLTAAQTRDAVVDVARIVRRTLRLLRAEVG